jgi:hypothetical protein
MDNIKMMERLKLLVHCFSSKQDSSSNLTGENPTLSVLAHMACSCALLEEALAVQTKRSTSTQPKTMELFTSSVSKKEKAALMIFNRFVERPPSRSQILLVSRLSTTSGNKIQYRRFCQHPMLPWDLETS